MVYEKNGDTEARLGGRTFLYELAHVAFGGEPDESLFEALGSDECRQALRGLADDCPAVRPLNGYAEALAGGDADPAELERSRSAFNKAVAGLGANRASHPWESAYTNSKRLLMQVETLEVRNAYRAFGYVPELYPKVADDHLSLECAFLAALAKRSIDAYVEGDAGKLAALVEGQRSFLHDHLLKWIDGYASDLHEDAPGTLYDLVAAALAAYARHDLAFLDGLDG